MEEKRKLDVAVIFVNRATREKLKAIKQNGDNYDMLINRLIDAFIWDEGREKAEGKGEGKDAGA